jgi:hypothetical protein
MTVKYLKRLDTPSRYSQFTSRKDMRSFPVEDRALLAGLLAPRPLILSILYDGTDLSTDGKPRLVTILLVRHSCIGFPLLRTRLSVK